MKNSLFYNTQIILLSLVGLFPLIKFDWSSKALILFCVFTIYYGVKNNKISFDKKKTLRFFLLSSYFILLILSFFYSLNKNEGIRVLTQLSPLIVIPFIISFVDFKFSKKLKKQTLNIFVFINLIYSLVVLFIFFTVVKLNEGDILYYLSDYDKFQFKINENLKNSYFLIHKPYFSMCFVICGIYYGNLFFLQMQKINIRSAFYLLLFFYFSFWIFYAFSFPNVIALALCIIALLFIHLNRKYFFGLLTLVFISLTLIMSIKTKDIDVKRGLNFIKSSVTNNNYEVNDARKEIYKSYKSILKNSSFNDLIFGYGVGDVQDKLNENYITRLNQKNTKNLLFFSEEFNKSYWFKNNLELLANQLFAPDSSLTADLIYTKNSFNKASYNLSVKIGNQNKGIYTLSIYAKKNNSNKLILRLGDINQRAIFNIESGKVSKKFNINNAGVENVGNGWFRCFITTHIANEGLLLIGVSDNDDKYNFSSDKEIGMYLWGAQFENGKLTHYQKRGKELLKYAFDKNLNTHNNYLFFLMTTGITGLILFLISLGYLFYNSLKNFSILKLSFCIILALNFLTENILSRHWGLMFFAFMLLILFNNQEKLEEK